MQYTGAPGGFQFSFQAPDPSKVFDDPAFKFRLEEGQKAIERSAAARGTLLTGGTMKRLQDFGQQAASAEYSNIYSRALGEDQLQYGRASGEYNRAYANANSEFNKAFDIFQTNQDNQYNRLAGLAGSGRSAANFLGDQGAKFAGNYGTTLMNTAGRVEDLYTGAGNALAEGQVAGGNAWANAFLGDRQLVPVDVLHESAPDAESGRSAVTTNGAQLQLGIRFLNGDQKAPREE